MKKATFAALLGAVTALAVITPAASADSPWTRVTDPLGAGTPDGPLVDPAGSFCSFDLVISVVGNNELQRQFPAAPPAPANATETDVHGELVLTFTNTDAHVAVTRNVSGWFHSVAYVDSAGNLNHADRQRQHLVDVRPPRAAKHRPAGSVHKLGSVRSARHRERRQQLPSATYNRPVQAARRH